MHYVVMQYSADGLRAVRKKLVGYDNKLSFYAYEHDAKAWLHWSILDTLLTTGKIKGKVTMVEASTQAEADELIREWYT